MECPRCSKELGWKVRMVPKGDFAYCLLCCDKVRVREVKDETENMRPVRADNRV